MKKELNHLLILILPYRRQAAVRAPLEQNLLLILILLYLRLRLELLLRAGSWSLKA